MSKVPDPLGRPRLDPGLDPVRQLGRYTRSERLRLIAALSEEEIEALERDWALWAHDGQRAPLSCDDGSPWTTWVIKGGRGFGKTLAGAQWITEQIAEGGALSIALVGASLEDARRVMVEGRSGLLTVADRWVRAWEPSMRRLRFTTGAEATLFSGASPDLLRGPEHHLAWCDELAKWERAQECWDMLQLGLRLGDAPRALVTTTPRAGAALTAIMTAPGAVVTGGGTRENPHLSAGWQARIEAMYSGTRLGRQELDGELLPAAGALWTPELIARCRVGVGSALGDAERGDTSLREVSPEGVVRGDTSRREVSPAGAAGVHGDTSLREVSPAGSGHVRTLIAVDPPSGEGTCGIVACARDADGIAHVLADHSVTGRSPEGWARAVAQAAAVHGTVQVIAEANQGGKMVKAVLLTADPGLRVHLVTATAGKSARAEPVAMLFEAGKVKLWGHMPALEAQLCGLIGGGGYQGPGASPDRADAMVWGVAEVMRGRSEARVRGV